MATQIFGLTSADDAAGGAGVPYNLPMETAPSDGFLGGEPALVGGRRRHRRSSSLCSSCRGGIGVTMGGYRRRHRRYRGRGRAGYDSDSGSDSDSASDSSSDSGSSASDSSSDASSSSGSEMSGGRHRRRSRGGAGVPAHILARMKGVPREVDAPGFYFKGGRKRAPTAFNQRVSAYMRKHKSASLAAASHAVSRRGRR